MNWSTKSKYSSFAITRSGSLAVTRRAILPDSTSPLSLSLSPLHPLHLLSVRCEGFHPPREFSRCFDRNSRRRFKESFLIVMQDRLPMISRVSVIYLPILILSYFLGFISPAVVTLKSIEIYNMHQWFKHQTTIYFKCNGGNITILPDVKEANVLQSFNGEESWQPLTEIPSEKCKRCGFYEKRWTGDYVFDVWELCPSDFSAPDGNYTRFKEDEFNATFLCKGCLALAADSPPSAGYSSDNNKGGRRTKYVAMILISLAVVVVVVAGFVAGYKYWLKRKRQQEQARFLKLFEEGDDMEDELGLGEGSI